MPLYWYYTSLYLLLVHLGRMKYVNVNSKIYIGLFHEGIT
jgi:hypothetical protein